MLRRLYLGPLGRLMSLVARPITWLHRPRMVYGWRDPASGAFRRHTRMSSNVVVLNRRRLALGDHVWVWHHTVLDATEGISIGEGAQIGAWVGIFTHGSEKSIRLLGRSFIEIPSEKRPGYTRGAVSIGEYTFIGAHSVVLPGVTIGRGCLVGAGSLVTKDVPDFSIVVGNPARVVGSTIDGDRELVEKFGCEATYFDQAALRGGR